MQGSSRRLLESGPSPNNGWRAGNAAWETGFSSAAAASHGPLAPFLSLLQRALPTAVSHGAAPRGQECCHPGGLGHETLCTVGEEGGLGHLPAGLGAQRGSGSPEHAALVLEGWAPVPRESCRRAGDLSGLFAIKSRS